MCLWADPLNFAADQAEIEIYGIKKTAAREMGSEAETKDGKDEENVRRGERKGKMKEKCKRKRNYLPSF